MNHLNHLSHRGKFALTALPLAAALFSQSKFGRRDIKKRLLTKLTLLPLALIGANAFAAPTIVAQTIFGGSGNQQGMGIAVNGGNVYFSGQSATVGPTGDGVLGRYNGALSSLTWMQNLGGNYGEMTGVAVSNKVYASGDARSSPFAVDTVGGPENKGVTAATALGGGAYNFRTQTPAAPGFFPYGGSESLNGIAVSNSGGTDSIYVVGVGEAFSTYGWPNYGMGIAKLNEAGSVQATAIYGGGGFTAGYGVTTLGSNVVVVGQHGSQTFIRDYNSSLALQWSSESLAGKFNDVTAYNGDLYAVGVDGSGSNGRVARYSSAGGLLWSQSFAAVSLNGIVGLNGHLYAAGGNGSDAVLLDLDASNGNLIGGFQFFGGSGVDNFTGIAANSLDGSLYTIGSTSSSSLGANGQDMWISRFTTTAPAPVPEPETYAMLLAGLGLLGFTGRRRKNHAA